MKANTGLIKNIHYKTSNKLLIEKHVCKKCKGTYYTVNMFESNCPFHFENNSIYNRDEYTIEDERRLCDIRNEYTGKTISVESGLIIVLEILNFKYAEFILMPEHRIYVAPFSYIKSLENNQKSLL